MITTKCPVMEALLDLTLAGKNRQLLTVGEAPRAVMVHFSENMVKLLEMQLADAKEHVRNLELAITLSKVGIMLGCEVEEK